MNAIVKASVSPELKQESEEILKQLGLDMSGAIKVFLSQVVMHGGLPFAMRVDQPNRATLRAIEDSYRGAFETAGSVHELFTEATR